MNINYFVIFYCINLFAAEVENTKADIKIEPKVEINLHEKQVNITLDNFRIYNINRDNIQKFYEAILYNRRYYRCYDNGFCFWKRNQKHHVRNALPEEYYIRVKALYEHCLLKRLYKF